MRASLFAASALGWWVLTGCEPGPVLYLGNASPEDAGQDASPLPEEDASTPEDDASRPDEDAGDEDMPDAEGGDDDGESCQEASSCDDDGRPFCDTELGRCVECLSTADCRNDRVCSEERKCEDAE